MGRQYAGAVSVGESVDATFALRAKEMRASRNGEAYLSLEFGDRSGRISGIMFRPGREAESVPSGTVVHVRGTVTEYRGVRRISVDSLKPALRYEPRELLPASPRDTGEMMGELREHTRAIRDRGLFTLVTSVFGDRGFMARFRTCPATRVGHHASGVCSSTPSLLRESAARWPICILRSMRTSCWRARFFTTSESSTRLSSPQASNSPSGAAFWGPPFSGSGV